MFLTFPSLSAATTMCVKRSMLFSFITASNTAWTWGLSTQGSLKSTITFR
ncbi:Uncharacterised protein [Vibrio cholerae]|nr:Uncharacterised protein [Vibrio cholerae]